MELTEETLLQAFCSSLSTAGFGGAINHWDNFANEPVLKNIPVEMHTDFPERLLMSVTTVCSKEPYYWCVSQKTPSMHRDTLFKELYEDWMMEIVSD